MGLKWVQVGFKVGFKAPKTTTFSKVQKGLKWVQVGFKVGFEAPTSTIFSKVQIGVKWVQIGFNWVCDKLQNQTSDHLLSFSLFIPQ